MGDGFGYIEVNGPKQDVRPFDLEDFNDAEAGGEPELSEIVPRWAIFSETLRHSDRRAQEMQKRREPAEGSLPKGTARANVCFGKCLQLPRTVVDQLHKSHLAQQDELDGLKLLHQKRVENLQRQEYLKETWRKFWEAICFVIKLQNAFKIMFSILYNCLWADLRRSCLKPRLVPRNCPSCCQSWSQSHAKQAKPANPKSCREMQLFLRTWLQSAALQKHGIGFFCDFRSNWALMHLRLALAVW